MQPLLILWLLCGLIVSKCYAYPTEQLGPSHEISSAIAHRNDADLDHRALDPLRFTQGPKRLSIHVTVVIDPVNITLFLQALKPAVDAVVKERLNTFFEVFQNPDTPGEFRWVEHWSEDIDYFNNVSLSKFT